MSITYKIKSFVEILEDYKIGLEEHLYSESAEREKYLSDEQAMAGDGSLIIMDYKLLRPELIEIRDEIGRVRLFVDVLTKFLSESN